MIISVNVIIIDNIDIKVFIFIGYKLNAVKHISSLNEYNLLTRQ